MNFLKKITGFFQSKEDNEEAKEEQRAPDMNDPEQRRRKILESYDKRVQEEPPKNQNDPKQSEETKKEQDELKQPSPETREKIPSEIKEVQRKTQEVARETKEETGTAENREIPKPRGDQDSCDLYDEAPAIEAEARNNGSFPEPKEEKKKAKPSNPSVHPLTFIESILNISVDPHVSRAHPETMYFPELGHVLSGLGENQLVTFENTDTCLFEILKSGASIYFETSIQRFEYLEAVYSRLVSSKASLKPTEFEELDKMVTGYALNLLLSPWIFDQAQLDQKLIDFYCQSCFHPPNQILPSPGVQSFIWHTIEVLDQSEDEERVIELLNVICKKEFLVDKSKMDQVLLRDKNCLLFFVRMLESQKFIFRTFIRSEYSLGADWVQKETNLASFQAKSFFLRFLRATCFPLENNFVVSSYQNERINSYQSITKNKTASMHSMVYEPFEKLLELYVNGGEETRFQVVFWAEKVVFFCKHKLRDSLMPNPMMMNQSSLSDGELFNFALVIGKLLKGRVALRSKDSEIMKTIIDPFEILKSELMEKVGPLDFNGKEGVLEWRKTQEEKKEEEQVNSDRAFGSRLFVVASYANHLLGNIWKKYMNLQRKLTQEAQRGGFSAHNISPTAKSIFMQVNASEIHLLDLVFIETSVFVAKLDLLAISELVLAGMAGKPQEETLEDILYSLHGRKDIKRELIPVYMLQRGTGLLKIIRQVRTKWMSDAISLNTGIKEMQSLFKGTSVLWLLCLGDKNWCRNPHVRAEMMQSLSIFIPSNKMEASTKQEENMKLQMKEIGRHFQRSIPYQEISVQSLMTFFIDIEKTGSHNQFFEKFSYRYAFFLTLNYFLGVLPGFKERIQDYVATNHSNAMRFVNLTLNDLIFLLDEVMNKITGIKALDHRIKSNPNQLALNQLNMELQRDTQMAKNTLIFLYCYCEALLIFATCVPDLLLLPELVDKFCNNINYVMVKFHGKEAIEKLKLDPTLKKTIGFRPEKITGSLTRVLIEMRRYPETYEGLIRDGRSFSLEIYSKTWELFLKNSILKGDEISKYEEFFLTLQRKSQENEQLEKNIDSIDVPEEFMDPIMSEIMKDPVLLPTSKNIVDRITIMKHLLSDPSDPFNRQPLNESELIPQPELKMKIQEFLKKISTQKTQGDQSKKE